MSAHTPGPWHWYSLDGEGAKEDEPYHFIQLEKDSGRRGDEYMSVSGVCSAANARLIAAAPALLAALEEVRVLISEAAATGFNCKDGDWPERLFFSQQKTSAVIARAKGETL